MKLQVRSPSVHRNASGGGATLQAVEPSRLLTPPLAGVCVKDVQEERVPHCSHTAHRHAERHFNTWTDLDVFFFSFKFRLCIATSMPEVGDSRCSGLCIFSGDSSVPPFEHENGQKLTDRSLRKESTGQRPNVELVIYCTPTFVAARGTASWMWRRVDCSYCGGWAAAHPGV